MDNKMKMFNVDMYLFLSHHPEQIYNFRSKSEIKAMKTRRKWEKSTYITLFQSVALQQTSFFLPSLNIISFVAFSFLSSVDKKRKVTAFFHSRILLFSKNCGTKYYHAQTFICP